MRVLQIAPLSPADNKTGGLEKFIIEFVPALRKLGVDAVIVGVSRGQSQLASESHFPVIKTDKTKGIAFRFYLGLMIRGRQVVRPGDIIHCHRPEHAAVLLLHRNPKIVTVHTSIYDDMALRKGGPLGAAYRLFERYVFSNPGLFGICRVVFASEKIKARYDGLYPGIRDISISLRTGIDTGKFSFMRQDARDEIRRSLGIACNSPLVLSAGRLDSMKGIPFLLESFKSIEVKMPGAVLLIAGEGAIRGELESKAKSLGLKNARFVGNVENERLPEYYAAADVFAVTSLYEGGPITIYESLSCATPVVSTDVGVAGEMIRDGVNGYVVKARSPEEFATKILAVLRDKVKFRQNCEREMPDVSIESSARKYKGLYEEIAESGD